MTRKGEESKAKPVVPRYQPPIPFPQRLVNIDEIECEMPKFSLYLKEHKRKLDDVSKVVLNEECCAVLQKEYPPKLGDPGTFCGALYVDLGASINVMTSFVANWLFLPPLIPTRLSIRLADDSIQFSKGIAKDMLVHVKGFIIPVDVVLDVGNNDLDIPLIFGKPFLDTCRAIIDIGT
nr:uncharacterized protein LOC109183051 [Ipomoea batatas]